MEQRPIDLRGFRLANNITQGELADYLGVTRGFISSIENGRANLPDKKFEYLYTMSKKEKSWDTDVLLPYYSRLKELTNLLPSIKSSEKYENGRKCFTYVFPKDTLGISQETYNKISKGKLAFTRTIVEQLTQKNPNINSRWLMTGEGDPFLKEIPNSLSNDEIHQELQALRSEVKELKEALQQLTKMIHSSSPLRTPNSEHPVNTILTHK